MQFLFNCHIIFIHMLFNLKLKILSVQFHKIKSTKYYFVFIIFLFTYNIGITIINVISF